MSVPTSWRLALAAALLLASACGGGGTPVAVHSPSPVQGALAGGLIAYLGDKGVGVVDPATGKSTLVAPLPGGAFRASGPIWAPAPGVSYPVLYFTIHDDRPAERRTTAGVVPYNWLFRADPFSGLIEPVAASIDLSSNGPIGIVANAHYLALNIGCCANYEVDAFDLTRPPSPPKVVAKPPTQAALFTEGAAPGPDGLIAVRAVGTGAWYWLNPTAAVLNPFPLSLGPEDGPIAISADGTLAAVSLPDQGPVIQPINVVAPIAAASPAAGGTPSASPASSPTHGSPVPSAAPRHVNSKLSHADGLAWSPDAKDLAVSVNGEIQIYSSTGADGAAPLNKFLSGGNVTGVDWSAPMASKSFALVKPNNGPQPFVDALLDATKLPAAADNPAARAQTKIYLWQFDSSKPSPIAAITDATPAVLQQYPPLSASVIFHHWAPLTTWELIGGCTRYRVVITGSVPPTASTFGLPSNVACSAPAVAPTPSPSPSK